MLIAVFITEMVILHKYVYLFIYLFIYLKVLAVDEAQVFSSMFVYVPIDCRQLLLSSGVVSWAKFKITSQAIHLLSEGHFLSESEHKQRNHYFVITCLNGVARYVPLD